MRTALAVSFTLRRRNRPLRGCIARLAFGAFALAGILASAAQPVAAQTVAGPRRTWELIVPTGTLYPTGSQGDAIRRASLTAVHLSWVLDPSLALVGSFGWARSRDIASPGDPKLDLFTYDLGAEVRGPRWRSGPLLSLRPFAGLGAGARSYNYRSLDVDATHNPAAYGSLGAVVGVGRLHLRVEARDYVTGFTPLDGAGRSDTRNDVALMFGFRLGAR